MIFVGFFFGGIVVGPFSDKFGRKITMYLSGLILSVMSLLAAFPEAFWLFALLRCLIGFGIGQWIERKERLDEKSLSSQWWNTVTCMWCKVLQTFLRHSIKHSTCSSCWEQMTLEETGLGHVPSVSASFEMEIEIISVNLERKVYPRNHTSIVSTSKQIWHWTQTTPRDSKELLHLPKIVLTCAMRVITDAIMFNIA